MKDPVVLAGVPAVNTCAQGGKGGCGLTDKWVENASDFLDL